FCPVLNRGHTYRAARRSGTSCVTFHLRWELEQSRLKTGPGLLLSQRAGSYRQKQAQDATKLVCFFKLQRPQGRVALHEVISSRFGFADRPLRRRRKQRAIMNAGDRQRVLSLWGV